MSIETKNATQAIKIRLKGELDLDLRRAGCRPGQVYDSTLYINRGAWFKRAEWCVVYPENYDIITK